MELTLFLSHACNLRCSYCYTGPKTPRSMPKATAERAIEFAIERDPNGLLLSFFGGEPLLEFELIKHCTAYARRRLEALCPGAQFKVHLNTNATLVDAEVEAFAREHLPLLVSVSLDGSQTIHDCHRVDVRGRGSQVAVRRGLERLQLAGARVSLLAVVNPDTASSLGDVADELLPLSADRVQLACNLRASWDETALAALRVGLANAAVAWAETFRAGKRILFEPFTTKILSHLHAAIPCGSRCQLAAEELVVAPSGRIYPCGELVAEDHDPRHVIGHIDAGIDLPKLEQLRQVRNRVETICEGCVIEERCSSACGCKHVALTGSMGAINSTLCDTEAAFIEAADHVAESLYAESCDAFIEMFYRQRWAASSTQNLVKLRRKDIERVD